jgi:hypothetical protein
MTTFAKSQTPFGRPAFSWTLAAIIEKCKVVKEKYFC